MPNTIRKTATALALVLAAGAAHAVPMTYNYAGPPVAIPDDDATGISVTISVPDSGTILDLNVGVVIEHTWQGDLIIGLSQVGGSDTLLFRAGDSDGAGFGFSADNFGNPFGADLNDPVNQFILDDEAAEPYDSPPPDGMGSVLDPGIDNVTGTWIPFSDTALMTLSTFDGLDINGDWMLTVADRAGGDTGSILAVSLYFDVAATGVPAPGGLALLGLALVMGAGFRRFGWRRG